VILILIVIALPRGLMGFLEKRGRPARDRKIESAPAAPSKREAGL
jgi:hypothetical protein